MSKRIISADEAVSAAPLANHLPKSSEMKKKVPRRFSGEHSDEYREQIFRDAFSSGYQAGHAQGTLAAREDERHRMLAFAADARALINRVESAMDLWYQKAEAGLARFATELASRIVAEEIQLRPEVILSIVREALQRVTNSVSARIRVNPADLTALSEHREELIHACQGVRELEFVGDEALSRGSVIIEGESGVIDARVEAKLDELSPGEAA